MNAANVIRLSAPRPDAPGGNGGLAVSNPLHLRFGAFELDESEARLSRDGTALHLAPRPFGLLCALARHPASLLTKNVLLDTVWGHQFVSESVLKTAISDLRIVLDDHPREPRFIETVSRRGYRFIATTTAITSATARPVPAPVQRIDFAGPPSFKSQPQPPARALRADFGADTGRRVVNFPVRKDDTSWCNTSAALPQPIFATMEEVRYAHALKLQLRARLLGHAAPPESMYVAGD